MEAHYHVWTRSGRIFRIHDHPYASRSHAAKVAAKLRSDPQDRMVRACTECPPPVRSKRKPPRWSRVAAAVAEAVGADLATVRSALEDAIATERGR